MFRNLSLDDVDLAAAFNASPNPYVVMDRDLVILGCNDAYLRAVGRRHRAEILGRNIFEAFPSDPAGESYLLVRQSLDRVLATGQVDHIAMVPYDTSQGDAPSSVRYWSATHVPVPGKDGSLRFILQHTVDISELQTLRETQGINLVAEAGLLLRAQEIQAQSQPLRDMFAQAPGFVAILTGPEHVFQIANDSYMRLVGGRNVIGKSVRDALPEVVDQGFISILDSVFQSGEPYVGQGMRILLTQAPGPSDDERFIDFVYQPLRDSHGSVFGIFVQGNDVTDQKRADHLLKTIVRESAHRVKNSLAVAQAVVAATLRAAPDLNSARELVARRLAVLATTQPAMLEGRVASVDIGSIVRSVMCLHSESFGSIRICGEHALIEPATAQGLALVLHELATNAVKHGALSTPSGQVFIEWTSNNEYADLSWIERGGPPIEDIGEKGFGAELMERALPPIGGGTALEVVFAPEGVRGHIRLALAVDRGNAH